MIKMRDKIAVRYIKWTLPVMLVFLIILGWVLYIVGKQDILARNRHLGETLTTQTGISLKIWIEDQIRIVKMIAEESSVIEALANPNDPNLIMLAQFYLREIHKKFPYYENLPIAVKLPPDETVSRVIDGKEYAIGNGTFIVDTVDDKTIGKGGVKYSYIAAAFEGKEYYISEVYPSILRGNPIFVISAPVLKSGKIVGAAIISPQMSYFTDLFVKKIKFGKTDYLFFLDDRGMVISHPNPSYILNNEIVEKTQPLAAEVLRKNYYFDAVFEGVPKRYVFHEVDIPQANIKHRWYIGMAQYVSEVTERATNFLSILAVSGLGFFVVISLVLIGITTVVFVNPIKSASANAQQLANYDLNINIDAQRRDEIGSLLKSLENIVVSFQGFVNTLTDTTLKVNTAVNEISEAVTEQASIASEQSSSVSEITSTMAELTASFRQIAEHADVVSDISEKALNNTELGAEAVQNIMDKMEEINTDNQKNIQETFELGKKSKEITKIMKIINNITDQTKLIAFNAAIEASRAGESGKRFGVVAVEIRRLAASVMESTVDIENKINDIQKAIDRMVIASEKSSKGIREGLEYSTQTASKLTEMVEGSQATVDAAKQISLSTQQQKTATEQILAALREIDDGARQTSNTISHISTISIDLKDLSKELDQLHKKFMLKTS